MTADDGERFELAVGAGGERVVGDRIAGAAPGYLFLHGLGSVRRGEKSTQLFAHARRRGRAAVRFDQRGHGESSGRIGDVTVSELIADAMRMLDTLGPTIVVGSSLGGLVGAFAAAAHPDVRGLALLAPALGFLPRMERRLDAARRMRTSSGLEFTVETRVVADAKTLDEAALPQRIAVPTLVVHGSADDVVPPSLGERFFAALRSERKQFWLVPGGDHRLNREFADVLPRMDELLP